MAKKTKKPAASKPVKTRLQPEPVRRRIGTIIIATAALENAYSRQMFSETLFRKFCPFFINVSPDGGRRAFIGFCDEFAEIGPNEPPPRYLFGVNISPTGEKSMSFTRYEEPRPTPSAQPTGMPAPRKEKRK